jgi:hypothetical protein
MFGLSDLSLNSMWRTGFDSKPQHLGFVAYTVALEVPLSLPCHYQFTSASHRRF